MEGMDAGLRGFLTDWRRPESAYKEAQRRFKWWKKRNNVKMASMYAEYLDFFEKTLKK